MTMLIFYHTFDLTGVSITYDSGWVILPLVISALIIASIFAAAVEEVEKR